MGARLIRRRSALIAGCAVLHLLYNFRQPAGPKFARQRDRQA